MRVVNQKTKSRIAIGSLWVGEQFYKFIKRLRPDLIDYR